MPKTQGSTIVSRIICTAESDLDNVVAVAPLDLLTTINLANGTGANAANQVWSDTRTLAASGSENLDLAGALTDAFGATITFTKIKAILIKAAPGNTNNVVIGAEATNPWVGLLNSTGTITLRPGAGFMAWAPDSTGMAVVASTGDLIKVVNSAGTTGVDYTIVVIGEA